MSPHSGPRPTGEALELVLLQVRHPWHDRAELQERDCFLERCGGERVRLRTVNLVTEPAVDLATVAGADAVMIGGAGSHSVTADDDPFTAPLAELVRSLIDQGRPLFGSCYGHQLIAKVLGGVVVRDESREEVGTFEVELTAAGQLDPLTAGLPPCFPAHFGHHDLVTELPPGVVELARSAACPNQMLRVVGKPVYGTQFHCEMTREQMAARLAMYSTEYLPADDLQGELDRLLRPTPDAESLLGRFLDLCVARTFLVPPALTVS